MTSTRFAPGPATAHVCDDVLVVTRAEGAVDDLMSQCGSTPEWSDLVAAFADRSDAAVVMYADQLLRVAVVGAVEVDAEGADGPHRVSGGVAWMTHEISGARSVTIRLREIEGIPELTHCVDAGAVPVAVVSRRLVAAPNDRADPFESLFGQTMPRSVEAAAVRADDVGEPHGRAPLGVMVFSTGERVVVDRSMVLGRNPHAMDGHGSDAAMRRVKLSSPGVSRQHAIVRVDRWHASIDDLGSSNGTWVEPPGGPVTTVRPGHPVDLVPGAIVDLGGAVSFALEEVA